MNSSSRPMVVASSTVMTPSLPTLAKASAISSPILASCAETVATWAMSSCSPTSRALASSWSETAAAAASMPRLRAAGFAPAATRRRPSMNHRLGQDCRRRGAVARHVVRLGGDLLGELGAKVLIRVLQLNFARDGDTVVRDGGSAPLLVDDDVAAAWPQRHLYGVRETVHAALKRAPGVLVELQNFRHEKPQTTVGQCFCLVFLRQCFCANVSCASFSALVRVPLWPPFALWRVLPGRPRSALRRSATRRRSSRRGSVFYVSGFHGHGSSRASRSATRPEGERHDRERAVPHMQPPRTPDPESPPARRGDLGGARTGEASGAAPAYLSMVASTSRAESTRYSSPLYFTSVPPYLL